MKKSLASNVAPMSKQIAAREPEGQEEEQDGGSEQRTSKAKSFDDVAEGSDVPDGKYEAIIKQFVLQDLDPEKGQSVRFTVVMASEDVRGEEITGWFKILNPDESAAGGAKFFKRTVAMLGYENIKLADIEECCEQITKDQPGVAIQKKTNQGFDNVYFNGYIEDSPAIRATHEGGFLKF